MRKELKGPQPYRLKHFKYSSHYWILKFLSEERRPLKILDVGAADGYLGAILKDQGAYVVGVERDDLLAQSARPIYDRFYHADIESFEFPDRDEFDFVIFGDVLEHVRDPAAVLRKSVPTLKKGGAIIVSTPNIANIIVRINLLFGRFEYNNRGILDRTHLRFFTLRSVKRLLGDSGLKIDAIAAAPVPLQLVMPLTQRKPFAVLHALNYLITLILKPLFGYQFVIRAHARLPVGGQLR